MWSRVYEAVARPSVHQSVPSIDMGLLLNASKRYRSIAAGALQTGAQQQMQAASC